MCSLAAQPLAAEAAPGACEREMARAAARHAVPIAVLYAVALTESGRAEGLSPYAVNVEGRPHFARHAADAVAHVEAARRRGVKLIDLGCMQINHFYHGMRFASTAAMFEPAANVDFGARFLRELMAREGSWTSAVARYHAGPRNPAAQRAYVCRVIGNMVAAGLGGWTARARAVCAG